MAWKTTQLCNTHVESTAIGDTLLLCKVDDQDLFTSIYNYEGNTENFQVGVWVNRSEFAFDKTSHRWINPNLSPEDTSNFYIYLDYSSKSFYMTVDSINSFDVVIQVATDDGHSEEPVPYTRSSDLVGALKYFYQEMLFSNKMPQETINEVFADARSVLDVARMFYKIGYSSFPPSVFEAKNLTEFFNNMGDLVANSGSGGSGSDSGGGPK